MDFNLAVILRESARRAPGKTAVIQGETKLSYAQLDELSIGSRPTWRRPAWRRATGSGAAAEHPVVRRRLLRDPQGRRCRGSDERAAQGAGDRLPAGGLGARALITYGGILDESAKAAESAGLAALYVVGETSAPATVTAFEALLSGDAPGPQLAERSPADPAVIIYTSGTTGTPKGAVLAHISLYMNADIPGPLFEFSVDDTVLVALPLFHVFGLSSVMNTCVLLGGTMTLVPRFEPAPSSRSWRAIG